MVKRKLIEEIPGFSDLAVFEAEDDDGGEVELERDFARHPVELVVEGEEAYRGEQCAEDHQSVFGEEVHEQGFLVVVEFTLSNTPGPTG